MAPMTSLGDTLRAARGAQRLLARVHPSVRDAVLDALATRIDRARDRILAANAMDLARATHLSVPLRDRLMLTPARLDGVVRSVREVSAQPDPLGEERAMGRRPNGLRVFRRRVPLGVLAVIYEARPNVTVEAAALALRSGNAVVLRGGSEALDTNVALADCVTEALRDTGLPTAAVALVTDLARERVVELLGAVGMVDLAIPRGGAELMATVDAHARVPVVRHGRGVCHVYVDASAEVSMAVEIAFNAKVQRPGVCNAMETLLVHRDIAMEYLPRVGQRLNEAGVTLRADPLARAVLQGAGVASEEAVMADWDTEFLDRVLAIACVTDIEAALEHISTHGTGHTAAIVTRDEGNAERFLSETEASCVLWNASTRFNDGGELGLGAEIGISTSRMHAFGPMGARELTAEKFVVRGDGQVRG